MNQKISINGQATGQSAGQLEVQPKLIVMPLQPVRGQEKNGLGLGIHFFLGNLICLYQGLLECWFGWRVKKIFPEPETFMDYCQGLGSPLDFQDLAGQERVRFWIEGKYLHTREKIHVFLVLHEKGRSERRVELSMAFQDGLVDFRTRFFDWLRTCGLPFQGVEKALWPEQINIRGLDCLGRALEVTYLAYIQGVGPDSDPMDLAWFVRATEDAPDSYLAHDLLGWGLSKNREYQDAKAAFASALALNPQGLGALSGMMWCGIYTHDQEMGLCYALAKAGVRGEDLEKARAFVEKKFNP